MEFSAEAHKITLVPKAVLDQVTLSPRGEKLLDESLQDVKKGKIKAFDDAEQLICSLKERGLLEKNVWRSSLRVKRSGTVKVFKGG